MCHIMLQYLAIYVIYLDTINGSKYTINNLQSDTLYNITVTSIYNSGTRTITQTVKTKPSIRKLSIDMY